MTNDRVRANDTGMSSALAPLTPHFKLMAAMGILQGAILNRDSDNEARAMFPGRYLRESALELAEMLMADVLDEVEASTKP